MSQQTATPGWSAELLARVVSLRDLTGGEMATLMHALLDGSCPEPEAAALLVALRMKGETAEELAAAATVMRERMVRWDAGRPGVLDTCGTGGDGAGTFNISTATALVVAACGVPVVKHGNRAASGRTGSADVLTELGVRAVAAVDCSRRCLEAVGLAFCFAPLFHSALAGVAPLRRRLGIPTLFNWLGPLANPAGAEFQLLGVSRPELVDPMAGALARLGSKRALVVCGKDGLDEVTLSAATVVRLVDGQRITSWEWQPSDFGLAPCALDELRVSGPVGSAAIIRQVLAGVDGAPRRIVLANAAAGLLAAQRVHDIRDGVRLADDALRSGRAAEVLERLVGITGESPAQPP